MKLISDFKDFLSDTVNLNQTRLTLENGGGKLDHGSGGIVLLRAA